MAPLVLYFDTKLVWGEKYHRNSRTCGSRSRRQKYKAPKADVLVFDMSRRGCFWKGGEGGQPNSVTSRNTNCIKNSNFRPSCCTRQDRSVCWWVLKINVNITHCKLKTMLKWEIHSFQKAFTTLHLSLTILKCRQISTFDDNNQN